MFDIGVIGRTVWDNWQVDKQLLRPGHVDYFGGPGANTSVALSNYGLSTSFSTFLGKDQYSDIYYKYLAERMDMSYSIFTNKSLPIANITPEKKFFWENGEAGFYSPNLESLMSMMKECSSVFFVEPMFDINLLQLPRRKYLAPQLSLDLKPEIVLRIINISWNAIFFNYKEKIKFESIVGNSILNISNDSNSIWIITNGSEATEVIYKGEISRYPVEKRKGQYAVGCGDVFAASYCMADISGMNIDKAILLGHEAASKVLLQIGCQLDNEVQKSVLHKYRNE